MTEIVRALPRDVVELISATEEGAVRDHVRARFIVMAYHEASLDQWLRDSRDTEDFVATARMCKQFGEVVLGAQSRVYLCLRIHWD